MTPYLLVFFGAGLGGALRHGVNLGCARLCGLEFPWGTLVINVLGSGLMGLVAGWFAFKAGEAWSQSARLFLTTGVLGGFTTFSAFSLDAILMWERGELGSALLYIIGSVVLSLVALVLGLALVRSLA
jgi:fluoride exporter